MRLLLEQYRQEGTIVEGKEERRLSLDQSFASIDKSHDRARVQVLIVYCLVYYLSLVALSPSVHQAPSLLPPQARLPQGISYSRVALLSA